MEQEVHQSEYFELDEDHMVREGHLAWDAPEYHFVEKTPDWYWSLGIITVSIIVILLFFNEVLFALFILLAAIVSGVYAGREPGLVHVELGYRGIIYGKNLYLYNELDSFWVEESHHSRIIIKSKKTLMPYIVIPIGDTHPDDVRDYLAQYLPEVEHREPIGHKLMEYLGF